MDEELYSRQLYVIGHEAMRRMMQARVLVIGVDGLGQEIAKDLCLAGIREVILYDKTVIREEDLSAGFYFPADSVGREMAATVLPHLATLNKYVRVSVADDIDFSAFDVLVAVNQSLAKNIELDSQCRAHGIKFVMANVSGLFARIFVDLLEHTVVDANGEPASTGAINDITENGVLTLADGSKHALQDGDLIKIGKDEYRVKVLSRTQLQLLEYPTEQDYRIGGDFEQVKEASHYSFRSLQECIGRPVASEIVSFDDEERASLIHAIVTLKNKDPKDIDDEALLHVESEEAPSDMPVDRLTFGEKATALLEQFKNTRGLLIAPMCSVIGGFAAQEVIKAVSQKFVPLHQFFYFNVADLYCGSPSSSSAAYGRYGPVVSLFGEEVVARLLKLRVFLVGAGAIGCEHLKNFVMSGIGEKGRISITDMDSIEQSNLNRQFLFRESDVGKLKSESAARQAAAMNTGYLANDSLRYFDSAVGKETEHIFSDQFLQEVDIVANALDNVEARNYMDNRCIFMRKPMFDAGTLGTKGHLQSVLPFVSESYGSTTDAAESSVPMCTVKSYPYTIEHTIEWALEEFRKLFHDDIVELNEYIENGCPDASESEQAAEPAAQQGDPLAEEGQAPEQPSGQAPDMVAEISDDDEDVHEMFEEAPRNAESCIKKSIGLFANLFSTRIQKLLSTFPADYITREGIPFWSPPKRPPIPVPFNINDKMHILFVESCTNLFATCFNIRHVTRNEVMLYLENLLNLCEPNPIHFDDIEVKPRNLTPVVYDKDSWHVDFIYTCANLRARNYKIKEQSKHFIRGVSGKIIPAIATTTAVVSGLTVLEIFRHVINLFRPDNPLPPKNAFLDLGMPFLALTDVVAPQVHSYTAGGETREYTLWSRIELRDAPLRQLLDDLGRILGQEITMVSIGSKIVYWNFSKKYDENLTKTIAELCKREEGQLIQYVDFITDDEIDMEAVAVIFE